MELSVESMGWFDYPTHWVDIESLFKLWDLKAPAP
jgi:hypothetical protein